MRAITCIAIVCIVLLSGCSNPVNSNGIAINGELGDLPYIDLGMSYWTFTIPEGNCADYHISVYVLVNSGWQEPFWKPDNKIIRIYNTDGVTNTNKYRILLTKI